MWRRLKKSKEKPVIIVLSSCSRLGQYREPTGFNFEELAKAYYILQEKGFLVDIASIKGGASHPDPAKFDKDNRDNNPRVVQRFINDPEAMYKLRNSLKIKKCRADDLQALCLVGGHGAMHDFPGSQPLQRLIREVYQLARPIATIGHGAAAFVNVAENGRYLVSGHKISATTNEEEYESGRCNVIPFLLESRLRACGARFVGTDKWQSFCVEDAPFISGQNAASTEEVGRRLCIRTRAAVDHKAA